MNEDTGEIEQVTTLTLTVVDLPMHEVHRLARAAGEKVQLEVELIPTIEQAEFDI